MKKKEILLVDDNIYILEILEIALGLRYNTSRAQNGLEAIAFLERNHVDLILLDLNMPYMSGLELFEHLKQKKEWKNIPVVFLSGALEKEGLSEKLLAQIMKADDFIEKPVLPDKIIQRIEKILSRE